MGVGRNNLVAEKTSLGVDGFRNANNVCTSSLLGVVLLRLDDMGVGNLIMIYLHFSWVLMSVGKLTDEPNKAVFKLTRLLIDSLKRRESGI